jgi:hypothetical protein
MMTLLLLQLLLRCSCECEARDRDRDRGEGGLEVEVEAKAEVDVEVEAAMPVDVDADVDAARTVRPFTALPKAEPSWVWPSGRDTLSAGMAPPTKILKNLGCREPDFARAETVGGSASPPRINRGRECGCGGMQGAQLDSRCRGRSHVTRSKDRNASDVGRMYVVAGNAPNTRADSRGRSWHDAHDGEHVGVSG